jgi:hypothetical protein
VITERELTCRHEAGHVAALVMVGRLPRQVRVDRPDVDLAGVVHLDLGDVDHQLALDMIVVILLGPMSEPRAGWPPEWPIDPDDPEEEIAKLSTLAAYLDLEEADWWSLVRQANHLLGSPAFLRIRGLIEAALSRIPALDAGQLRRLLGPDLLHTYGIATT